MVPVVKNAKGDRDTVNVEAYNIVRILAPPEGGIIHDTGISAYRDFPFSSQVIEN